jgi:hypothetical protein
LLGGARQAALDFRAAIPAYESALAIFEKLGSSVEGSRCRRNLASTLLYDGNAPRAEQLASEALSQFRGSVGESSIDTLESRRVVASAQAQQGRAAAAVEELRAVVDLMSSSAPGAEKVEPWRAARARSCLGEAQSLAGQQEQALQLLCDSYKSLRDLRGGPNADTRLAARRLAGHFERAGDADSARAWMKLFDDGSAPAPADAGCH